MGSLGFMTAITLEELYPRWSGSSVRLRLRRADDAGRARPRLGERVANYTVLNDVVINKGRSRRSSTSR